MSEQLRHILTTNMLYVINIGYQIMYLNYVISIALSENLTSLPFRYEEKSIFWIQLTETSIRCYHCYIARQ